jgi:hypothetical protein
MAVPDKAKEKAMTTDTNMFIDINRLELLSFFFILVPRRCNRGSMAPPTTSAMNNKKYTR